MSVSKDKKVCSIISYLQQKWTDAIGEQEIRLYPKDFPGSIGWGSELSPSLHVDDIAKEINCLYKDELEFEYKIESFLSPRCTEIPHSNDFALSKEIDITIDTLEKQLMGGVPAKDVEEEEGEEGATFLELVNSAHHSTPPYLPQEHGSSQFFDASRDGFDMLEDTKKYEGKCREFWYNREDSVDYSSMFAKKKSRASHSPSPSPSPKKRKLSASPI